MKAEDKAEVEFERKYEGILAEEYEYYDHYISKKCSFCKEQGHFVSICGEIQCPKLKENKCKICHEKGHTPKYCLFSKKINKKNSELEEKIKRLETMNKIQKEQIERIQQVIYQLLGHTFNQTTDSDSILRHYNIMYNQMYDKGFLSSSGHALDEVKDEMSDKTDDDDISHISYKYEYDFEGYDEFAPN
jgi:hypothetical protein